MGSRRHPDRHIDADFDEHAVKVAGPAHEAAGVKDVLGSLQRGLESMGAVRTAAALARLNQRHGFDYPETNPLVPLDHTAARSNTPVSKAIVIRLERT